MAPKITAVVGACLYVMLGACVGQGDSSPGRAMQTFAGAQVIGISPDNAVRLKGGVVVSGDARLVSAIVSGEAVQVTILERFPPDYVVVFSDGSSKRYPSTVSR